MCSFAVIYLLRTLFVTLYLLIQIVHMAHICENNMIQIKHMFQIVATGLLFSTEEYTVLFGTPGFISFTQ